MELAIVRKADFDAHRRFTFFDTTNSWCLDFTQNAPFGMTHPSNDFNNLSISPLGEPLDLPVDEQLDMLDRLREEWLVAAGYQKPGKGMKKKPLKPLRKEIEEQAARIDIDLFIGNVKGLKLKPEDVPVFVCRAIKAPPEVKRKGKGKKDEGVAGGEGGGRQKASRKHVKAR